MCIPVHSVLCLPVSSFRLLLSTGIQGEKGLPFLFLPSGAQFSAGFSIRCSSIPLLFVCDRTTRIVNFVHRLKLFSSFHQFHNSLVPESVESRDSSRFSSEIHFKSKKFVFQLSRFTSIKIALYIWRFFSLDIFLDHITELRQPITFFPFTILLSISVSVHCFYPFINLNNYNRHRLLFSHCYLKQISFSSTHTQIFCLTCVYR